MNTFEGGFAAALTCALLTFPAMSIAAPVFSDDFDSDSATSVLNFTAFENWTVSDGTVDYIRNGGFGLACHGGSGGCVDLDGSTSNAGVLTSKTAFHFDAGTEYTLSFWFSGNQRNSTLDTLRFGIGGLGGGINNIPGNQPFTQHYMRFSTSAAFTGNIFFSLEGSDDNIGAILDDVQLSSADGPVGVPEPGTPGMLVLGLLALGMLGLSTKRTAD